MRNIMKATTLESRFPLLSVEHGCIVSKDADITAAFEVELPEVYTVTAEEYEGIHATWCKAIKVLPDHSVLHKQDWYVKERYRPDLGKEGMGFLARSYEMHFNERPFLHHKCYLFLTKTTKERMRQQSNWNTLCRGHIVPKEIQDKETAVKFIEAVEQFARILNRYCAFRPLNSTGRPMPLLMGYSAIVLIPYYICIGYPFVRGRTSAGWSRLQSGRYTRRTSLRRSSRCRGRRR